MRDYSSSAPPNLFSSSPYSSTHSQHQQPSIGAMPTTTGPPATRQLRSPSTSSTSSHHTNPDSSSTASSSSRRRGNEHVGEQGYYSSSSITDEPAGSESPNKRARTGSLSEHGTEPLGPSYQSHGLRCLIHLIFSSFLLSCSFFMSILGLPCWLSWDLVLIDID